MLLAVPLLQADDNADALDAVAPLAAALADGDAGLAMSCIPGSNPDARELRVNVAALLSQAAVTSSVEVITAGRGEAELDWYMEIRSRETQMVVERRRAPVKITHRKRKLQSLAPASFFAPPAVAAKPRA